MWKASIGPDTEHKQAFNGSLAFNDFLDNIVMTTTAIPAVPEPETYALMLAGLGLVGFAARRKQKTAL